jgi:hypothetical protein
MIDWEKCGPLKPHRVRFLSSDGRVHDVMRYELDQAREIDPDLRVLATSSEEWTQFCGQQKQIERDWNKRNMLTDSDLQMLRGMGVSFGKPLHWGQEEVGLYSLRGDED